MNLETAIALWQSETARISGLATKAAATLSAQALVAAGLTVLADTHGTSNAFKLFAAAYVASGLAAAVLTQLPRPTTTLTISDLQQSNPAQDIVTTIQRNELLGIHQSNLATASVCDTARALSLLLLAVAAEVLGV